MSDGDGPVAALQPLPGTRGWIVCIAISPDGRNQINHNHLAGTATIINYDDGTTAEYTAWAFQALKPTGQLGTGGQIVLDNVKYDRCPSTLYAQMSPPNTLQAFVTVNTHNVAILPCHLDVRQNFSGINAEYYTEFSVYRGPGPYGSQSAWACHDDPLLDTDLQSLNNGASTFAQTFMGQSGYYRVITESMNPGGLPCSNLTRQRAGIVGVHLTETFLNPGAPLTQAVSHNGAGGANGFVLWDLETLVEEGTIR
jgi:hypothetical protein